MHNRFVPIPGFPNYLINDEGKVFSKKRNRFLKPYLHKAGKGYYIVKLNNKRKFIHRLVLETFIGPCPRDKEGCHKNGDTRNNNLYNLYWGTHSENMFDMVKHGYQTAPLGKGELHPNSKLTKELVLQIREAYALDNKHGCYTRIGTKFGVSRFTISSIINGRTWGWFHEN